MLSIAHYPVSPKYPQDRYPSHLSSLPSFFELPSRNHRLESSEKTKRTSTIVHFKKMTTHTPGTGSSRYIPQGYDSHNGLPHTDGDKQAHLAPPSRHGATPEYDSSRPYTPPSPEQYDAHPSYRAPLDDRPANPNVQAVQASAGYGGGRPRSASNRSEAPSHHSHRSHHHHHAHDDGRRPSHGSYRSGSHRSHKSHHSTAAKSHHSSGHSKSGEEPYRTESERQEYIKGLKKINSNRPT
jgi:hypothetical protein